MIILIISFTDRNKKFVLLLLLVFGMLLGEAKEYSHDTINIRQFNHLARKMTRKMYFQDSLQITDVVFAVQIYNTLCYYRGMYIAIEGEKMNRKHLQASRMYLYLSKKHKVYQKFSKCFLKNEMNFAVQLECDFSDRYWYSRKYDIYIGGGTVADGGGLFHPHSRYTLIW